METGQRMLSQRSGTVGTGQDRIQTAFVKDHQQGTVKLIVHVTRLSIHIEPLRPSDMIFYVLRPDVHICIHVSCIHFAAHSHNAHMLRQSGPV